MEVVQKYVTFLLFSLYISSLENVLCHNTEVPYLSRKISIFGGNKHFDEIKQPINYSKDYNDSLVLSVLAHGAIGDGVTDDAEAFKTTWDAACKTDGGIMLIPSGYTFLLQPVKFDGNNCPSNVVVQMDGNIVAPNKSNFHNIDFYWILFEGLSNGIQIKGNGIIDGRGASWWGSAKKKNLRSPHAVGIVKSLDVTVTGITIKNSPRMHIFISESQKIKIYNFTVDSPEKSRNTDGIHISRVQHAIIHDSTLACGDDCISIQTGCSDVKIYNVHCGPGHGYSIGGLGPNKDEAHVSDISVLDSTVHDALNGVRIKTWPGGTGSVQGVVFSGITMSNVKNPIVIDQDYCNGKDQCDKPNNNAVAISNVSYTGIHGTYSATPVSLVCSEYVPCRLLNFTDIDITPAKKPASPHCEYAYGELGDRIIPSLTDCLSPSNGLFF